jgi:hypothetical protein
MKALDVLSEQIDLDAAGQFVKNLIGKDKSDPKKAIDATSDQSATSKAFHDKLAGIAKKLRINASDLIRIMHFETAGTMKANKLSPSGRCIGLIQFCPIAQRSLGVTKAELASMTEVEQLDYVYEFFKYWNLPPGSDVGQLYLAVLMPVALNKKDDFVVGQKDGKTVLAPGLTTGMVYAENSGFDKKPKKGYFTVADVKERIETMKFY